MLQSHHHKLIYYVHMSGLSESTPKIKLSSNKRAIKLHKKQQHDPKINPKIQLSMILKHPPSRVVEIKALIQRIPALEPCDVNDNWNHSKHL